MDLLATSGYTFRLPLSGGYALFNANTGAVLRLDGPDADELSALLSGPRTLLPPDTFDEALANQFLRNGFLIREDFDELASVRERYWTARGNSPVVLLVTTTMDCNLGCYYCYESRSTDALRLGEVDDLLRIAEERLDRRNKRSLHVDWYGGEPLLNLDFLERASLALQDLCRGRQVAYHASVISNGTRWPADIAGFVARHRIRQVQISFDGLKENHDRRRRYRAEYHSPDDTSSFEQAAGLVDQLLQHARVDVRFNADRGNADDFQGFIEFARARGWFDAPHRCVILPARLSAYSDRSQFLRQHQLSAEALDELERIGRETLPQSAQDETRVVAGFPRPKTSVCGALAPDSTVIGSEGLEYRCGLQVGEPHRAVGRFIGIPGEDETFPDRSWWESFDPTTLPTCSRCSFLPVCWGGCPKRHLEQSKEDTDAEGRYWRTHLPRLIATGFGETAPEGFAYTEGDQFRA